MKSNAILVSRTTLAKPLGKKPLDTANSLKSAIRRTSGPGIFIRQRQLLESVNRDGARATTDSFCQILKL